MEKKNRNEELQSRREFFKKAAKGVLPILGAVVLAGAPAIVKAAEENPMGCKGSCYLQCDGGCRQSCNNTCRYHCLTTCKGGCDGSCKGTCQTSCMNTCSNSCVGYEYM